jgi:maltose/moltooligosaccharide transporter
MVGSSFGTYNIVSAIVGFILPFLAAKLSRKVTHAFCLVLGGIALIAIRFLPDPSWMHVVAIGIGFAWSSILTMPYAMLTNVVPSNRMGYFVGVFNFFIVIPQIVAGSFSGLYIKLLGGDAMLGVTIGGISMLIAAVFSLRVQDEQ